MIKISELTNLFEEVFVNVTQLGGFLLRVKENEMKGRKRNEKENKDKSILYHFYLM